MTNSVVPFSLKDAPALIERLLPVQKLSAEAYKEQMAVHGKTLTALGSYWKGRKPLILNKACIHLVILVFYDRSSQGCYIRVWPSRHNQNFLPVIEHINKNVGNIVGVTDFVAHPL